MSGTRFDLSYEYDEKRQGYCVTGDGFDFFAYFTDDDNITYLEADVQRNNEGFTLHVQIQLGTSGKVHRDILETALDRELGKYWDC